MRELLNRHTDLAIVVILFLEELGIPMPLPSDMVIMYVGYRLRIHALSPWVTLPLMFATITAGVALLYTLVRHGGRPLVDRFGPFVHLGGSKLNRAEVWLQQRGAGGIILGRSLPGVRLATVIACGLFKVPPRVFFPAQFIGTTIYVTFFLMLGYVLGPHAAAWIHLPALSLRLVLLILLLVALPLVLRHLNRSTAGDDTATIEARLTRLQVAGTVMFAAFLGMIEQSTMWAIGASLTKVHHRPDLQRAGKLLAGSLDRDGPGTSLATAYVAVYVATTVVCFLAALVFFQTVLPRLRNAPQSLIKQTVGLWQVAMLLEGTLLAIIAALVSLYNHGVGWLWPAPSGPLVLLLLSFGLFAYAYVTVQARRLAVDRFSDTPVLVEPETATEGSAATGEHVLQRRNLPTPLP
ncbi:MAG: hypothetical protein NVSMB42_24810 [Herpetosiphon sp.]